MQDTNPIRMHGAIRVPAQDDPGVPGIVGHLTSCGLGQEAANG